MNTGTKGIAEQIRKPFTAEELSRHDEQLKDWPDARPSLETLERYLHNIRSLLEEAEKYKRLYVNANVELDAVRSQLAAKDKVLELITDLWGLPEIHKVADSILSKYAKEP